jgi:hypothetical protein
MLCQQQPVYFFKLNKNTCQQVYKKGSSQPGMSIIDEKHVYKRG